MQKIEGFINTQLVEQLHNMLNEEDDNFLNETLSNLYSIQDHLLVPSIVKIWQNFYVKLFDIKPFVLMPFLKQNIAKLNLMIENVKSVIKIFSKQ
jgi:hypothetical protein